MADLVGLGRPQIVWSRPHMIATGPQPTSVFVTTWAPGSFVHLPGQMAASNMTLALDGTDLLLTGISRSNSFIRHSPMRTDRYRFVEGAFRLMDRHFLHPTEFRYDRFWDGTVAEAVGRLADAQREYRAALEPQREAHRGSYPVYNGPAHQLSAEALAQFDPALRAFARFRLGGLLLESGRPEEARAVLTGEGLPYPGLLEAMWGAKSHQEGCEAGARWAQTNPDFLVAINAGVGHSRWTPELLCSYPPVEEDFDR